MSRKMFPILKFVLIVICLYSNAWGEDFKLTATPDEGQAPLKGVSITCSGKVPKDVKIIYFVLNYGDGEKEEFGITPNADESGTLDDDGEIYEYEVEENTDEEDTTDEEETTESEEKEEVVVKKEPAPPVEEIIPEGADKFSYTFIHDYISGSIFRPYFIMIDSAGVQYQFDRSTTVQVKKRTFSVEIDPETRQGIAPLPVTITMNYDRSDQRDAIYSYEIKGMEEPELYISSDKLFVLKKVFDAGVYNIIIKVTELDDKGKTFYSEESEEIQIVVARWQFEATGSILSSPAVDSDTHSVYFGTDEGYIYSINDTTAELNWKKMTGGRVRSSPTLGPDGTVYCGSEDGTLYALLPDGSEKWRFQTQAGIFSSPAIDPYGTIYFGSSDFYLYAIDSSGVEKWRFKTGSKITASPTLAYRPDAMRYEIYIGSLDGNFYALDLEGNLLWTFEGGDEFHASAAISGDGTLFIPSCKVGGIPKKENKLYCLNAFGEKKWDYAFSYNRGAYSSPAISSTGTVFVGAYDDSLHAVNTAGTYKWAFRAGGNINSSPAIGPDETVMVGSQDNKFYALDFEGKLKWLFTTEDEINTSPTIDLAGNIFVGSDAGYLYSFRYDWEEWIDSPSPYDKVLISTDQEVNYVAWPMFRNNPRHNGLNPMMNFFPGILSTSPDYNEEDVPIDLVIKIEFSKDILEDSIEFSMIKSRSLDSILETEATLLEDHRTVLVTLPNERLLDYEEEFTVNISAIDLDEFPMLIPWTWKFKTKKDFLDPEPPKNDGAGMACFLSSLMAPKLIPFGGDNLVWIWLACFAGGACIYLRVCKRFDKRQQSMY